jgi:ABC-2 type transport system ATP-binding protein
MHALAGRGRTVFVSSHLMSEMSLTAQHLIVIGRGRLLADMSTADFIANNSRAHTRVRSPQGEQLAAALTARGGQLTRNDGYLEVDGMSTDQVGDIAAAERLTVHELFTQRSSLEEAFMELTRDSVEYHAAVPVDGERPEEHALTSAPTEVSSR